MSLTCEYGVHESPRAAFREEQELCLRVQAEFREMPGLRLTLPQAARLFSVDRTRCERVLDALVHAGHLTNDGKVFASSRSGRRWA
jgi:hypothetical protein